MGRSRPRWWVVTNFNVTGWPRERYSELVTKGQVRWIAHGVETCPKTKKCHHQIYMYFHNPQSSPKKVGMIFAREGEGPQHAEPMKGTIEENEAYCSKEEDYHKDGIIPEQGKRSHTFADAVNMVKEGKKMSEILEETTSYQVTRGALLAMEYLEPARRNRPQIAWVFGSPGIAVKKRKETVRKLIRKTLTSLEIEEAYYCDRSNKWWHGYDRHQVVHMKIMKGEKMAQKLWWSNLMDDHPWLVETKGGFRQFVAEYVIIDAEMCPEEFGIDLRDFGEQDFEIVPIKWMPSKTLLAQKSGGNTSPRL